ncbi:unnamed protein product [Blepharisma stoltei]|uniref:F-box associated domain-containing protein n=1 Tax=Blepharisma stoltei TaxID=1481888 RepID=A0AAU9KJN4_9CILI|nr:unnamed protein product [Blepharisma stoltei]
MANNILVHKIQLKKPIESSELFYFIQGNMRFNTTLKLWRYNIESFLLSYHYDIKCSAWIFTLPRDEKLWLFCDLNNSNKLFVSFLSNYEYQKSIGLRRSSWPYSYQVVYCDGYIYTLGCDAFRCKIVDKLGNIIENINWIRMPHPKRTHMEYFNHEFYSCIGYYDKMLITETRWDSLYLYDEFINSYSQLPVILRTGCKVLTNHELKVYVITFSGPIYVNLKGDLAVWNILSLNFFDTNPWAMVTSTYYKNSFYIANDGDFYKFDFHKESLEKLKPNN